MANAKLALEWIINILKKHNIPFQIAGGLAAIAYDATRELADIDIDIPEDCFEKIQKDVGKYIIYGPAQFNDGCWDLTLMTLHYHGQDIDVGGAYKTKIYNKAKGQWEKLTADFSTAENKEIFGLIVSVINREALIHYKKILGREVDLLDVSQVIVGAIT